MAKTSGYSISIVSGIVAFCLLTIWQSTYYRRMLIDNLHFSMISSYRTVNILQIEVSKEELTSEVSSGLITTCKPSEMTHICGHRSYQEVIAPCKDSMKWVDRPKNKSLMTNVDKSIVKLDVGAFGYANSVQIITKDMNGELKTVGGDFWDVSVISVNSSDRIKICVDMVDKGDGKYIGHFFLPDDNVGQTTYRLQCILEYSQCNGIRDPPSDWFIKGTIQGKFQREGTIGDCNDFLHQSMKANINFQVPSSPTNSKMPFFPKPKGYQPFNRYCGYWRNNKFHSYLEVEQNIKHYDQEFKSLPKSPPLDTLRIFGDSMGRRFYESLHQNHTLCSKWFKKCLLSNIWVYKIVNIKRDRYEGVHNYDGKDFNQTKFVKSIEEDLTGMKSNKSVYVFNFGCHTVMTLSMEKLQLLLKQVMEMIVSLREKFGEANFPTIVWKSTTPPSLENFLPQPSTQLRFLTKQRIQAWNGYSLPLVSRYKIPILDVYTMATSYPDGPFDIVHYENFVFKTAEDDLELFILTRILSSKI